MRRRHKSFVVPLVIVVLLGFAWMVIPKKIDPYPRRTMVIVGSPMTVFSWNEQDRALTLITVPEDMTADGTHGYGTYSFESFWKLGEIDKKDGTVLSESVSEAFGVPVGWYIGPKTGIFGGTDALTRAKDTFSLKGIVAYMTGAYRTNIPISTFISYMWLLQVTKPGHIETYDFTHTPTLIADDVTIADGSHSLVLNPVLVDARLAHVFEDDKVRRETVSTAVYNTTDIASLGTRVARFLGNLGVSVVSVGNDNPEVDACTVSGTKMSLSSASAKVIRSFLGCTIVETQESQRADLTVRIGKSYAKRFLPN